MMDDIQKQLIQKESEIAHKILQLAKNEEIGYLLSKGSCLNGKCGISRNTDLSKVRFNHIIGYLANINELNLERLQKKTLYELGQLLALYLEKEELFQQD